MPTSPVNTPPTTRKVSISRFDCRFELLFCGPYSAVLLCCRVSTRDKANDSFIRLHTVPPNGHLTRELQRTAITLSLFDFHTCTTAGVLFGTGAALVSPVSIRQHVGAREFRVVV